MLLDAAMGSWCEVGAAITSTSTGQEHLMGAEQHIFLLLAIIIGKKTFTTPYNVKTLHWKLKKNIVVFLDWHDCPVLLVPVNEGSGSCSHLPAPVCLCTQSGFAPALTHKPGLRSQPAG